MDWKDIQETTRALGSMAAQKINAATDLAALHLQLKTLEYRRRTLCEEFGREAYVHFTSDADQGPDVISRYVRAIALTDREMERLRAAIALMQDKKKADAPARTPGAE